jgi:hypothetical protein
MLEILEHIAPNCATTGDSIFEGLVLSGHIHTMFRTRY